MDGELFVYALHHAGDYTKGEPRLVNRFSAAISPHLNQGGTMEEARANARLIKAAPRLLEALKALVARCDGDEGVQADGSNMDTLAAHAVIAEAEGGEDAETLAHTA